VILQHTITLTPAQVAEAFCDLDDEGQAQVFIEVARVESAWPPGNFQQWQAVGRHLRDCSCSSEEAREIVSGIAEGMAGERFQLPAPGVAP
jgi:hypothetical protein